MPFRAPDPHNLLALSQDQHPLITTDRACEQCGYNLRGLHLGQPCPECGTPSLAKPVGVDDPLSFMPPRVIFAFIKGCWLASLCIVGLVALWFLSQFNVMGFKAIIVCLSIISVAWVGSVLALTPAFTLRQASLRGFSAGSRLRRVTRWLQLGWVVAAAALLMQSTFNLSGGLARSVDLAQSAGLLAALTGTVLLSILLERLAEWARDPDAERMFNWATWGLPIVGLIYLWQPGNRILALATSIISLIIVLTFPYGLISLSKSVTLSALHSLEHKDRLRRRDERSRRFDDHIATATAKTNATPRAPSRRT